MISPAHSFSLASREALLRRWSTEVPLPIVRVDENIDKLPSASLQVSVASVSSRTILALCLGSINVVIGAKPLAALCVARYVIAAYDDFFFVIMR